MHLCNMVGPHFLVSDYILLTIFYLLTIITYTLRIRDDNYISITRATYTQTLMPLHK
jgi:hypothetical protein